MTRPLGYQPPAPLPAPARCRRCGCDDVTMTGRDGCVLVHCCSCGFDGLLRPAAEPAAAAS